MIHVVHVVTRTNIGGPSVILESLLADSSNDIRYTIVRGETDPTEGDYFAGSADDDRFVTIEGLGRSISPLADLRAFVQLVKTLRSLSPDVVHTHMAKAVSSAGSRRGLPEFPFVCTHITDIFSTDTSHHSRRVSSSSLSGSSN